MSVLHIVKVTGKSKSELVKALHAAIRELDGETVSHNVHLSSAKAMVEDDSDDEYETVESPYVHLAAEVTTTSTVVDNEKDAENLPWDSRIHSGGKSKNNDGTWKKRKGVDSATILQVKAELLGRGANATIATAPTFTEPTPTYTAPVEQAPVVQQAAPVVNIPSVSAPLPQIQAGHTVDTFKKDFPMIISTLITQGKLTQEYINMLTNHFGVKQIWEANDDQRASCFYEFVKCGIVQQVG